MRLGTTTLKSDEASVAMDNSENHQHRWFRVEGNQLTKPQHVITNIT